MLTATDHNIDDVAGLSEALMTCFQLWVVSAEQHKKSPENCTSSTYSSIRESQSAPKDNSGMDFMNNPDTS